MKKLDNAQQIKRQRAIRNVTQPLIASLFGLLIGAVVIIACGHHPVEVYAQMFTKSFLQPYYLFSTLTRSTPVIICALATAMAWRAGYINIGVEGQMVVGAFTAAIAAAYIPGPSFLVGLLSWIIGMAAGALYALIAAVLNYKSGASLVITTLMMNYIANYLTSYLVSYPLKDRTGDGQALQTIEIRSGMHLPRLTAATTFNVGFVIAILVLLAVLFITKKTVFGYESRMSGLNSSFARYGGTKEVKVMMITMALSGAIAAIAGSTDIFGLKFRYADAMFTSTGYAWTGLMAALIADLNPIGMTVMAIFLSGLQIGGSAIQRSMGVPLEIATIIQCCITLFVSVKIGFRFFQSRRKKEAEAAGKGGEPA